MEHHPVVIGAGSAGLTAAYELIKAGIKPIVLEKPTRLVVYPHRDVQGYHFDIGGHRFSPKSKQCSSKRC